MKNKIERLIGKMDGDLQRLRHDVRTASRLDFDESVTFLNKKINWIVEMRNELKEVLKND